MTNQKKDDETSEIERWAAAIDQQVSQPAKFEKEVATSLSELAAFGKEQAEHGQDPCRRDDFIRDQQRRDGEGYERRLACFEGPRRVLFQGRQVRQLCGWRRHSSADVMSSMM